MKKLALLSLALISVIQICNSQTIPIDSLYLGQIPPGNMPKVFASALVSITKGISFSPDGTVLLFRSGNWPNVHTMIMQYQDNKWNGPATITFSKSRSADEANFSPDGKRIYYYAYNAPNSIGGSSDICYSEKIDGEWGEPINLGKPLNTAQDDYHPCVVLDTSIYFEDALGLLYYSKYQNGSYSARVALPAIINKGVQYGNAYVSPDESFIIFNSNREGGYGSNDIYISYKKEDGTWTNPKNLGNKINTSSNENSSDITPDGKYMTYVSNNLLYWVSASFIDSFKTTNFIPYVKNSINNQTDSIRHLFVYTISDTTFFDDDGNGTLTYTSTLINGNSLPSWLQFNPDTKTFSGTLDSIGTFTIKVTATDIAKAYTSTTFSLKVVGNSTNLTKQTFDQNIQVFPNPTKDKLNISFGSLQYKSAAIEIIDMSGKLISADTYQNLSTSTIDLTGNPAGFYFIGININGQKFSKKICKE